MDCKCYLPVYENKKSVLVVIVTYNAIQWIHKCIQSLLESTIYVDIYIIDNGSTDGTQKWIIDNCPRAIFYQSTDNLGFGKANNIGFRYAIDNGYDYVYLLNQDAWVLEDTISTLLQVSAKYPDYGIVSPIQCSASLSSFDDNFFRFSLTNENVYNQLFVHSNCDICEVDFVMAAHWLVSRECLLSVGAFSPSFPHYGEDDNYIQRAIYHGFKVGVTFNARAVHDRANRPLSNEKSIYLTYIHMIVDLSNPIKLDASLFRYVFDLLKSFVKYRTFAGLRYLLLFYIKKSVFVRNRLVSTQKGAFLN